MGNISILEQDLISKIAAGEVVERPASVVKELVENSIDAGAKNITIEIMNGGQALIRVTDDGCGMSQEDALLSLERHATSKLKTADDLFNIHSLGFRGEALPSIASVSRFELITNNGSSGVRIYFDDSRLAPLSDASPSTAYGLTPTAKRPQAADHSPQTAGHSSESMAYGLRPKAYGCPKGTTIIVKDLFYNTPARLKYLKKDSTELSHVLDIVSKLTISYPGISFKLIANGKEELVSSGNGDLLDSISSVYGASFAKGLLPVKQNSVSGFVSKPSETKAGKDYQLFFVNGRYIKHFLLNRALEAAYHSLIPHDRHPAAVLFLEVDPAEIDVNVHPAKREVRFEKTNQVVSSVSESVKNALIDAALPTLISSPRIDARPQATDHRPQTTDLRPQAADHSSPSTAYGLRPMASCLTPMASSLPSAAYGLQPTACPVSLGQIDNTYIICADGKDLLIIDQHAAHERIIYEKVKSKDTASGNSQYFLIPEIIEFNAAQFICLEENTQLLNQMGFGIEIFGKNSLRVSSIPFEAVSSSIKTLLEDLAQQLKEIVHDPDHMEKKKDAVAKIVACHSAIKAGDKLSAAEIKRLLLDLYDTTNPSTCPHGRPSIVKIENSKLARFFDR